MKVLINAFCLICIFLCGQFSQSSLAQSRVDAFISSAQKAVERGDYAEASLHYEKAHFFGNAKEKNSALEEKALALKDAKQFDNALDALRRIRLNELDAQKEFSIRYQMILCAFLAEQYGVAKSNILMAEQVFKSERGVKDLLFMKILVANAMMEWDKGEEYFEQLRAMSEWSEVDFAEIYGEKRPKIKDPRKASLWSTFLPGSGQIYAGSPGRGFLSAGTQALCFAYGLYHLVEKFYFTSFFSGFALFQAFYFGGAEQAAILTEENNKKRVEAYNQGIKASLIELMK